MYLRNTGSVYKIAALDGMRNNILRIYRRDPVFCPSCCEVTKINGFSVMGARASPPKRVSRPPSSRGVCSRHLSHRVSSSRCGQQHAISLSRFHNVKDLARRCAQGCCAICGED